MNDSSEALAGKAFTGEAIANESQWYVVKSKTRKESVALEQLSRQNFVCFYPRMMVRRKRGSRYVRVVEALFKNYLFIKLDLSQQDISPIRSTRGVQELVRFGNKLVPVPPAIIASIKSRVDENEILTIDAAHFRCGQKVTIEMGSFAGLEAIYCEPKGENRALLLINLLGRMQRVVVPMDTVA